MAVDELNLSRDEMLSDIGITRDELVLASRFRGMGSIGGHSGVRRDNEAASVASIKMRMLAGWNAGRA